MMQRLHRPVVWCFVVLLAACGRTPQPSLQLSVPPLVTLNVQPETAQREQVWDGVVEAVDETTIAAQTNARVLELPHDVGDHVAKGEVLVRFSDIEQQSGRRSAVAAVAAAQANLNEAQAAWKRIDEIYRRKLVALADLDQAVAHRDAARATLASAQAGLRAAGQQTDYTVVRAPFAGVITRRLVQVGEAVQSGPPAPQPLIALASLENLRVRVQVPQSAIAAIRQFNAAQVLLDASGVQRVQAEKITVFPYADPATHSFNLRLDVPVGTPDLYPGMTVKVAFAIGADRRLLLPTSALAQRGELDGVYVLAADNHLGLRQLRLGHRFGDKVEVLSGLVAGEKIASDPAAAVAYLSKVHAAGNVP